MGQVTRYSQNEKVWEKSEQRRITEAQLAQGFQIADIYLNRSYLDSFSAAPIISANRAVMDISKLRLMEITKLVFDANEKFTDKLKSVYSSLHSLNSSVALIIDSEGEKIKFFIGIRSEQNASIAGDILESTLKGNFPGIVFRQETINEIENTIMQIQGRGIKSISTVSIVPSMREEMKDMDSFVQGIEKFIDTMNGKSYTMVCLASPLNRQIMEKRKHGYEELCSALTPHSKLSVAFGENESLAVNKSISASFSKSVNRSVSNSNTTSSSRSSGTNASSSSGSSYNSGFSGEGSSFGWGGNSGYSNGSFDSYTSGNSFTQAVSDSEGSSSTEGMSKGETETIGSSKTVTLNFENTGVNSLIQRAQAQLERFKMCESFGMWEFCSYFMSKDIHTTALAIGAAYYVLDALKTEQKKVEQGESSNHEILNVSIPDTNKKYTFTDVTSHGIGIVCTDNNNQDINSVILPKNTQVPAAFTNRYRTSAPFQEKLYIQVTQGEEEDLRYVTVIGTAEIEIEPREKIIGIEVTISCDENSIIHVRVYDLDLQRDLGEMHIDRISNLTEEEVRQNQQRISKLDISGE